MHWNIVELAENGRYVRLNRGFLLVMDGDQELGRIVIDEITCLLLTAEQATLSKPVIVRLSEIGVPIIICGSNYHPISITLPYSNHHQSTKVLHTQMAGSKALKKRLWQQVVKQKISHQLKVLRALKPNNEYLPALKRLVSNVRSGDPENIEAQAAKVYWSALFGDSFKRQSECETGINSALNYGYTVIRAACARAVMAAGLHPALGIHHHNMGNPFCLVDDLMEIYRPLVDYAVYGLQIREDLLPEHKRELVKLLQANVLLGEKNTIVTNTMQAMAFSLVQSFSHKKAECIMMDLLLE